MNHLMRISRDGRRPTCVVIITERRMKTRQLCIGKLPDQFITRRIAIARLRFTNITTN